MERRGVLSHEYVLMMLLTFHSLTQEMRMTQFKKLFLTPEHAPKDPTPFNGHVLARIDLMAAYMVTHNEEMAPDLPEDVRMSCLPAPSRRRRQRTSRCHSSSAQTTASSRSSALMARQRRPPFCSYILHDRPQRW